MKLIYKYILFVFVLFYSANTFAQACEEECGGGDLAPVLIVHYPPPPPPAPPAPPPPPPNNVNPGNGGSGQRNNPGQSAGGGGNNSGGGGNRKDNGSKTTPKKTKRKKIILKVKHAPIIKKGKKVKKKIKIKLRKDQKKKGKIKDGKKTIAKWVLVDPVDNGDGTVTYNGLEIEAKTDSKNITVDVSWPVSEGSSSDSDGQNEKTDSRVADFVEVTGEEATESGTSNQNPNSSASNSSDFCNGDPCCINGCDSPSPTEIEIVEEPEELKFFFIDRDDDGYHVGKVGSKFRSDPAWKETTLGVDCDDTNPERNINCEKLKWYLDVDGDGYHGDISFAVSNLSTSGVWKSTTKGQDCNDYNKNDTTNCCEKEVTCQSFFNETFDEETCRCTTEGGHNWYLDNDGDDYHSQTKRAKNKPGANWKEGTSRGQDCNDSLFDEENICIEDEIVALLNPNNVLIKGTQQEQTPKKQIKHQSKETDKYAKRSVKRNINKTFAKQSFNNCTTASLGFIGKWILRNEINESQLLLKLAELNGALKIAKFLRAGLTPEENIQVIKSLYNTQAFTTFKAAIDNGKAVMTDVFIRDVQEPNPENPEQLLTYRITHAVAVVGYTETGDIIFFDPAEGNFQVAPAESLNQSYAIVLKSTK